MDSADTRFHNDRVRAAQRSLVGNQSAVDSLRTSHKGKQGRLLAGSVGAQVNSVVDTPLTKVSTPPPARQNIRPSGPPQGFEPMFSKAPDAPSAPEINPQVKQMLDSIHTDNLVNSPDMEAAYTKVKLRDYFHDRNSGPDVGRQVLDILNSNGPK